MDEILADQTELQAAAKAMLTQSKLMPLLSRMGELHLTGSYTTGLMVYPDIDFAVQHSAPDVQIAIELVPVLFAKLKASKVQVTDFANNDGESATYYLGLNFPYEHRDWQVSATVSKPGPIVPNPPELTDWLADMTEEQRLTILRLKKELHDAGRYGSSKSVPPYTFRSVHLYEAVLKGGAASVAEMEDYFKA